MKAIPVLLLLAACAARAPEPPRMAEGPDQAACRAEAAQASTPRDTWRRMNDQNATLMDQLRAEAAQAQEAAFRECLRRRGVRRGGGVERVAR
jgi:hypothetical protein